MYFDMCELTQSWGLEQHRLYSMLLLSDAQWPVLFEFSGIKGVRLYTFCVAICWPISAWPVGLSCNLT